MAGLLEKDIEKDILEYLCMKDWFCWKNPTIGVFDPVKKTYRKSRNKYQITGASDIIAIKGGLVLFIEVKSLKGKQTDNQKDFEQNIKTHGGFYLIARSVDDVKEKIDELLFNTQTF